jgi:hypothetical protein
MSYGAGEVLGRIERRRRFSVEQKLAVLREATGPGANMSEVAKLGSSRRRWPFRRDNRRVAREAGPVVLAEDLDRVRHVARQAAGDGLLEAVVAVADAGLFEIGTVAVGDHPADLGAVGEHNQRYRAFRTVRVVGPALDAVATGQIEMAVQDRWHCAAVRARPASRRRTIAREARRLRPEIRVLLASGYSRDRVDADEDMAFISKPYQMSELARQLAEIKSR